MTRRTESTAKRSGSLSWRLSLSQVGQLVNSYLKIDLLIVGLLFLSMVVWSEYKAQQIYQTYVDTPPASIEEFSQIELPVIVKEKNEREGIRLRSVLSAFDSVHENSYRHMGLLKPQSTVVANEFSYRFPVYILYFPTQQGTFLQVTIVWEVQILLMIAGLLFLIAYQVISLPFAAIRSRNRVRTLLRPIYELTATAETIGAVSPDFSVPLSGTIDVLNTITGSQFDKRITISDEREELQGLACAINNMLDRLDAAYQTQLRFVSDASHELRTPISIIQGYARLLSRWGKDDPKTLQESVDAIQMEAESMQKLVEQLLFLARTDNQSMQIHLVDFDVSDMLSEVVRETLLINDTHDILENITTGVHVLGDVQLIKQATRVLVDNALKYTDPEDGRITISLEETDQSSQISIGDNGIGVPADHLGMLFHRFWRADESRTRKTGGTGLGLSIAYWIIESHGGYISVVSRENVGSKFTISLPKTETLAKPEAEQDIAPTIPLFPEDEIEDEQASAIL